MSYSYYAETDFGVKIITNKFINSIMSMSNAVPLNDEQSGFYFQRSSTIFIYFLINYNYSLYSLNR